MLKNFFESIRFKIVLWYMLILTVTLVLFSLLLYHNFSQKLKSDMDDLLKTRAQGIADSIDAYWQAERQEISENSSQHDFDKENNINFFRIAKRWVNDKKSDPNLMNYSVHIFEANGRLVASSKYIPLLNISKEIYSEILRGRYIYDNWRLEFSAGKKNVLRRITMPVLEHNRMIYIVQVASSLVPMRGAQQNLILLLCILLPVTVIITAIAGAFLARVALSPVHAMIMTINQIKAENLKLRIDIPPTKDELNELAITFNEMIGRLDESFSSQRQFMQDISHELKTPLAILKGELEVTLKRARSAMEYESILMSSLEEVNRLVRIVDNLLTLARFDTKTITLNPEEVDLTDLIKQCLDDIRVLADQKSISLSFSQEARIVFIGDRSQLKRLILNLLDNAIKYTPRSGQISVDLWKEKACIKIEISDTGLGIPVEDQPFIFDRFYRVDKARGGSGFGLGLSIAKSIVGAHEGTIEVKALVNRGTTFIISLPSKNS